MSSKSCGKLWSIKADYKCNPTLNFRESVIICINMISKTETNPMRVITTLFLGSFYLLRELTERISMDLVPILGPTGGSLLVRTPQSRETSENSASIAPRPSKLEIEWLVTPRLSSNPAMGKEAAMPPIFRARHCPVLRRWKLFYLAQGNAFHTPWYCFQHFGA